MAASLLSDNPKNKEVIKHLCKLLQVDPCNFCTDDGSELLPYEDLCGEQLDLVEKTEEGFMLPNKMEVIKTLEHFIKIWEE